MANCVCQICKRRMDCSGEFLCDLCEIDRSPLKRMAAMIPMNMTPIEILAKEEWPEATCRGCNLHLLDCECF